MMVRGTGGRGLRPFRMIRRVRLAQLAWDEHETACRSRRGRRVRPVAVHAHYTMLHVKKVKEIFREYIFSKKIFPGLRFGLEKT